jgi:hypothetical protein
MEAVCKRLFCQLITLEASAKTIASPDFREAQFVKDSDTRIPEPANNSLI